MNYNIRDICCFCLNIANEKCSNKSSEYPDNLTPFDKIKTVLIELSTVMCSDSRICITCSKNVDFIYEFNKTCLRNINILNSYKKVLKENKTEKECELLVNLNEWKQFKDKLVSEATEIGSLGLPLKNNDTLCDADFVSESHSSRVAEVKEEIQINYVNCDEESERSWLGSEIKIETEETDLKQEWTSEITDPLMDASSKSTIRDFEDFPAHSAEEVVVKEEKNSDLVEDQVEKQSNSYQEKPIQTDDQEFDCVECGETLSCKFDLDRHMLSHSKTKSPTERRVHKCDTCGKSFIRKGHLETHMLIHTGEKPYKCDSCGKLFAYKVNLKSHMLIHTDEKSHKCDTCGKSFTHKVTLKNHMLIHTGEKPHKCDVCGKSFTLKVNLKSHMPIHTGEKSHKCDVCGKSFTHKVTLKNHMLIHTGEKPHKCDVCGKSLTRKSLLETHMLKHTSEKIINKTLATLQNT